MSKIHFTNIMAKNFHSFEEFNFPIVPGKHLIIGENRSSGSADSNGSGKSTLFEALPWNLWRKSIRDKDSSRNGGGNCYTKVDFIKDGNPYSVERYFKDSKEGNNIKFFVNGDDVSPRLKSGVDEEIQKVLNISPDLFISTIVVLQGLPINFSSLTPTVRKSIVEEMLGFSVWDDIRDNFSSYQREVSMKRSAIDMDLQKSKCEMIALNSKIDTIKKINSTVKGDLLKEMQEVKAKYKEVHLELTNITKRMSEIYNNKKGSDLMSEIGGLNTSLKILKNRSETLKAIVESKICPECEQHYPIQKIKSAESELHGIEPKANKIQLLVNDLSKTLDKFNTDSHTISKLELSKNSYDYQIKTISNKIDNNSVSHNLDEMEENLNTLLLSVNGLTTEMNEIDSTFNNIKYIDGLLLPSSKFRTKVLSKYIDYINSIICSVAPLVFEDVIIQISVDGKSSGVELDVTRKGIPISYKSLSGGEKRRLDIIIILSFQRFLMESSGISSNIIVFDEIFDALDKKGIENVLNCIDSLFPDSMSQYIITHNNSLRSIFSSIIKIVKENDLSRIEYCEGE